MIKERYEELKSVLGEHGAKYVEEKEKQYPNSKFYQLPAEDLAFFQEADGDISFPYPDRFVGFANREGSLPEERFVLLSTPEGKDETYLAYRGFITPNRDGANAIVQIDFIKTSELSMIQNRMDFADLTGLSYEEAELLVNNNMTTQELQKMADAFNKARVQVLENYKFEYEIGLHSIDPEKRMKSIEKMISKEYLDTLNLSPSNVEKLQDFLVERNLLQYNQRINKEIESLEQRLYENKDSQISAIALAFGGIQNKDVFHEETLKVLEQSGLKGMFHSQYGPMDDQSIRQAYQESIKTITPSEDFKFGIEYHKQIQQIKIATHERTIKEGRER